jgi:predicted O-linked N-acetylglucosamine transferase (SPINDLY family)
MPAMFECWMSILRQVESSVLWLLEESEIASNNLRAAAQKAGVDPRRLIFAPRMPPPDHLARHRLANLFIDTLPCNAHTTASDALWAGLPVLTCAGTSFPTRVAASLLKAVGLPEMVTSTLAEYEALAVALARDPARLAATTQRLAGNRLTAPLFDTVLFAKGLEEGYRQMYERYHAALEPEHIRVTARTE